MLGEKKIHYLPLHLQLRSYCKGGYKRQNLSVQVKEDSSDLCTTRALETGTPGGISTSPPLYRFKHFQISSHCNGAFS
jgi:hypothetical protein